MSFTFCRGIFGFFEEDWVTFFHLVFYTNSFHLTGSRQHTFLAFCNGLKFVLAKTSTYFYLSGKDTRPLLRAFPGFFFHRGYYMGACYTIIIKKKKKSISNIANCCQITFKEREIDEGRKYKKKKINN